MKKPTTRYFYDGQMAVEEDFENGSTNYVKRYGIGARGIDYIDLTENGTYQGSQFPIYDGHGNMVLTLARNGSSYSTANKRYFEAWGAVDHSAGIQTRNPSQRYCANLGHVEDDESGLTYMRARYYEPGVGRFLSEDVSRHAFNWFIYAGNNPVQNVDRDGNTFRNYMIDMHLTFLQALKLFTTASAALAYFNAKAEESFLHWLIWNNDLARNYELGADAAYAAGQKAAGDQLKKEAATHWGEGKLIMATHTWFENLYREVIRFEFLINGF